MTTQVELDRARIEKQTADFLAKGGKIKTLPSNFSGMEPEEFYLTKNGVPRRTTSQKSTFGTL